MRALPAAPLTVGPGRGPRRHRLRRFWRRLLRPVLVWGLVFTLANTSFEWWNRHEFPTTTTAGADDTDPRTRDYFPHTFWVFFPGFGIDFCPDVARALRPATRRTGQAFCVAPSPVALDPYEIADAVADRVRPADGSDRPVTLYLYGISMGGMIAYDVARILNDHDNITVRAVVLDSSPAGEESVREPGRAAVRVGAALQRLPNLPWGIPNPLKGGPLTRFLGHLGEAGADCVSRRRWPTLSDVDFAWYKATRVISSNVVNQLTYIAAFGAAREGPLSEVSYGYLGAADPEADTTVDVTAAIAAYRERLGDVPLLVHRIPGGTHASGNTTSAAYNVALNAFIDEAGLTTTKDLDRQRSQVPAGA